MISRAFADLATFARACARHARAAADGSCAMKGVYPDEEIAALPATCAVVAAPALAVPGLDAERHLVVDGAPT